jgi:hypothetical protein
VCVSLDMCASNLLALGVGMVEGRSLCVMLSDHCLHRNEIRCADCMNMAAVLCRIIP